MTLECFSTGSKQTIVVLALIFIIGLKIYGVFTTKTTWYLVIALAIVAFITDVTPTAAMEGPQAVTIP